MKKSVWSVLRNRIKCVLLHPLSGAKASERPTAPKNLLEKNLKKVLVE